MIISGEDSDDIVVGYDSNDTLDGGAGTNAIYAYGGADIVYSNAGNETLDGGVGIDTLSYTKAVAGVIVSLRVSSATQNTSSMGFDLVRSFENLIGSSYADTLSGDSSANIIDGSAGIDTVTYAEATGAVTVNLYNSSASGADGNDTLRNIENVIASSVGNSIIGDDNSNSLIGALAAIL